jgi:hypothetical protein
VESFDRVLLDDYEVHPFADPNGAPNMALFKSVLALQAQCASLTLVEQNNTQRDFTGMRIAP